MAKNLKVILMNIRSVKSKRNEIAALEDIYNFDIIHLTQTWTPENDPNKAWTISSFLVIGRVDNDSTAVIGGGTLTLAKELVRVLESPHYKVNDTGIAQVVTTKLVSQGKEAHPINAYRSPVPETETQLINETTRLVDQAPHNCVIVGDTSMPEVDFNTNTSNKYSNISLHRANDFIYAENNMKYISIAEDYTPNERWLLKQVMEEAHNSSSSNCMTGH